MIFYYEAVGASQQIIEGKIEASDALDAKRKLNNVNLYPSYLSTFAKAYEKNTELESARNKIDSLDKTKMRSILLQIHELILDSGDQNDSRTLQNIKYLLEISI